MSNIDSNDHVIQLRRPYKIWDVKGWTPDPTAASEFAVSYAQLWNSPILVVFITSPAESQIKFLDFKSGFYKTKAGKKYKVEQEVLNLEPLKITRAVGARYSK